jgi:hypothetical protein
MKHVAVDQYWQLHDKLSAVTRKLAEHNFSVIKQYPNHPLLRLKKIDGVWSMRIGSRYRALAIEDGDTIIWFWIGSYKQYIKHFR